VADNLQLTPIAYIRTDFTEKFGIPRQSGLVDELVGRVVFEPQFRNPDALREMEGFSHLWLLFGFSKSVRSEWSPTVRPPRLGGNKRVGVFASRSPFRPNPVGLSCVRFLGIEHTEREGDVVLVAGADLLDMTPIYDIKPYLPYADCRPEATGGFAAGRQDYRIEVDISDALLECIPPEKRAAVIACLAEDPRPAYHDQPERIYSMNFAGMDIRFRVKNGVAMVTEVVSKKNADHLPTTVDKKDKK